jgi:hypothetical protein
MPMVYRIVEIRILGIDSCLTFSEQKKLEEGLFTRTYGNLISEDQKEVYFFGRKLGSTGLNER